MAKKISQLTAGATPTGDELIEVVQGGTSKRLTAQEIADLASGGGGSGYMGNWVFSDHSNADPTWDQGSWGEVSGGDRGSAGDANYVQNGSLIFVTASGVVYK